MNPDEKQIILYELDNTKVTVDVLFFKETFWMTQKTMAELFDVNIPAISKHLKNIFDEGELIKETTISKMEIVQKEGDRGVKRLVDFYNLDAIIAIGYRVNSVKATRFRIWATQTLREFIIKGFVLNDDMLKNGKPFGQDYFQELLERVRSIRASERRIWQKITDIFAEVSSDYDKDSTITKQFYATVQNKFHYAITGKTAAEIIYEKADSNLDNMGLNTWKNAPDGRILKSDTYIAKNYLSEKEIKQLERNVSSYFDYVEDLIERRNTFTMEEFAKSIDNFLSFREYDILKGHGQIRMKTAQEKAGKEYEIFNKTQKINSDFDKEVKKLLKNK